MKKVLLATFVIIFLIFLAVVFSKNSIFTRQNDSPLVVTEESVATSEVADIRASFGIFTNGDFRSFSASMYHNLSSEVYISSQNPNVVVVRKPGTTWGDFFETMPFELTDSCLTTGLGETFCSSEVSSLKFYLIGERINDLLSAEIDNGDSLVVSFGPSNDNGIGGQIEQVKGIVLK
jgi:hypothetical protein